MPTTKVVSEAESHRGQSQQEQEEGTRSPCTPPLQSIELRRGDALSKSNGDQKSILNWSPQTPESLPLTSIKDVVAADAAAADVGVAESNLPGSPSVAPEAKRIAHASEKLTSQTARSSASPPVSADAASPSLMLSSSPAEHVDPQGGLDCPAAARSSSPLSSSPAAGGPHTETLDALDSTRRRGVFFRNAADPRAAEALFLLTCAYCDVPTLVQLMQVCRASHRLATSDDVWRTILCDMNLPPLLAAYERKTALYAFFLHDVVTTRALHGHYTFQAANNTSGSHGSLSNTSGSRAGGNHLRDDDSPQEDVFNIASLQLLITAASLGQANHLIGRVQLLLTYKNNSMEVLQGSCRFSVFRRCFSLCCSAFGTVKRGPVFTVAVATVTKPWANEGFEHFSEHKNGIRLVMTPVLWEGQSPGSQITEKDILVVSRPRPESSAAPTDASATEPLVQSCG